MKTIIHPALPLLNLKQGIAHKVVSPADDVEIPVECRNLPSTSSGIRLGMKNQ
jgi:hypothetical protein